MKTMKCALVVCALTAPVWAAEELLPERVAHEPAGIVWARGVAPAVPAASSFQNLVYHNGPVMHGTVVTPILWGTTWTSTNEAVVQLSNFYSGINATNYAKTNIEYTDGTGNVSANITYSGSTLLDNSASQNAGSNTTVILNEVCNLLTARGITPNANGYYPVYIDQARGSAGFCAWHSAGTCGGKTIKFAFFYKLDNDSGCNPGAPFPNAFSQGTNALANVSGHELSEMVTDPQLNAWYDRRGSENSDKCAWTFSGNPVTFSNGSWKIQGNWSNAANNNKKGYDGAGCIDGTGYLPIP